MSNLLSDPTQTIISENNISVILSHFNTNYIMDTMDQNINNRLSCYTLTMPNLVSAFENYFKQVINSAPMYNDKIDSVRTETYNEIIKIICNRFGLVDNISDSVDKYTIAFYLYDFFIAKFKVGMISFFTNYIIKEKNGIYESLNLNMYKKSKDSSTLYNKKTYKNSKLAIINANLEMVLNNMCNYDITLENILNLIYPDKNLVNFLLNNITLTHDFFKTIYVPLLMNDNTRIDLITSIRIEIHKQCINEEINVSNI